MCKLSNKRAKVVESSCGERYIHSRRCWQGRQSVFSLNLYEYWIIYFWFVCCFFFCFLDFRNTRTHFKTWTKHNASLHRWWGPTEVWGPPAWNMVSVANRWKAKGARIHTALQQDPQDASVSVLAKFSLFFSSSCIPKIQSIMLPKSSDLPLSLWDWNWADKISHNKQTLSCSTLSLKAGRGTL